MCKLFQFPGLYGIVVGICLLLLLGLLTWLLTPPKGKTSLRERLLSNPLFEFDVKGEPGSFLPLFSIYLDIAKFILGLASGSIALLVGSTAFR